MAKTGPGFTLIEIIAVLVVLSILALVALIRFGSLQDQVRAQAALTLTAAAQSQLSLEFTNRVSNGTTLDIAPQSVCDMVAISTTNSDTNLVCTGNMNTTVTITSTVEGVSAPDSTWRNPQSSE